MSGTDFSTENADYRQLYLVHFLRDETIQIADDPVLEKDNFANVDAVVLEAYHSKEWFDKLWKSNFKRHFEKVFTCIQATSKPTYIVDVLTTPSGRTMEESTHTVLDIGGLFLAYDGIKGLVTSRRNAMKFMGRKIVESVAGLFLTTGAFHRQYVMSTGENPEFLARMYSARTHLFPMPQHELRNAISARKVEEFVVPELRKKLKKTPKVVLVYGGGHSGMKEDMQYPILRNMVLGFYRSFGYPGIDTTYLDTATNLSITPKGDYRLSHRKCGLF